MLDLGALEVDVKLLQKLLAEQTSQIGALSDLSTYLIQAHFAFRQSHVELLDQHLALCDCVCKTRLISREDLLTQIRATRSSRGFRSFLEEPRPAHLLLQHLGLCGSENLLAASCEAARLLAEATAQCTSADRAREGGGCAPAQHGAVRQGADLPISLPSLWRVCGLAERLSCTLSAGDVRRLRLTCSSGAVRIAYCRIAPAQFGAIPAKKPVFREGPRRADLSVNESGHFCNFLQEIWQYSTLADALIYSMDSSGMQQFRVLSRGCCECMRSHRSSKQRCDPRRTRVPCLQSIVDAAAGQHGSGDVRVPPEAVPTGSGASKEAGAPSLPPEEDHPVNAQAPAEDASPALAPQSGQRKGQRGKLIRVVGLQRLKRLNGKSGRLIRFDETRHWHVVLSSGEHVRVRPDNVEFLTRKHGEDGRSEGARAIMLHLLCGVRGLLWHTAGYAGPLALSALATASESLFRRVAGQGRIFVLGGIGGSGATLSSVECLDLVSGAWRRVPEMLCPREGHGAAMIAGRIYVVGGSDGKSSWTASVERLDARGGGWEPMPAMKTPRVSPAVGVLGGLLYVVGGQYIVPLRSVERFDPVEKAWHTIEPMRHARALPTVVVAGGHLYALGGTDLDIQSSVERLSPKTCTWQALPNMVEARYLPATAAAHGSLFVCGGYKGAPMRKAERFDVAASEWLPLPPMVQARWGARAAAVRRGRGLVVWGGSVEQGVLAEALDLQADAWTAMPSSTVPRNSAETCLMAAGRLYVFGGGDAGGAISAVERCDLASEKWEKALPMLQPRSKASSFLTFF